MKMKDLNIAQIQMMEIIKAISYNSKVVIMDEPTSSLSEKCLPAVQDYRTCILCVNAHDNLHQCRLACTVLTRQERIEPDDPGAAGGI